MKKKLDNEAISGNKNKYYGQFMIDLVVTVGTSESYSKLSSR